MSAKISNEEKKAKLIEIFAKRAKNGAIPANDSELLQPEFIELTEDGLLTLKFPVFSWQRNGDDNLQGGMIGCMMDLTFGAFAHVIFDYGPVATISMTTNYLRQIGLSENYLITKTIFKRKGRRILYGESEAYNANNKLAVIASTNIMRL